MTRNKVTLKFIENDADRRTSYKKRQRGLIKKVREISTLCAVDACAIIYSEYDKGVVVWPSPEGVLDVLAKFQSMPYSDQNQNMVNQDVFTQQRVQRAHEKLIKLQMDNRRRLIDQMITQCLGGLNFQIFNMVDLIDIGYVVNHTLIEINMRMEALSSDSAPKGISEGNFHVGESSNASGTFASGNEAQAVQETVPEVVRGDGQGAKGWADSLPPYPFNAPGSSDA